MLTFKISDFCIVMFLGAVTMLCSLFILVGNGRITGTEWLFYGFAALALLFCSYRLLYIYSRTPGLFLLHIIFMVR